ncbi:MAG: sugar ABC transporter ATP-binding protein [Chloroflexi bacterium]|nr:sugar ABC transporter ATP-binding protein [Chloroflexota bacterium]
MSGPAGAMPPTTLDEGAGVVIRGLGKRYGDTIALADLDLVARPGRILGVAGPNGAGKSTMVKILAGEVAADSGQISIDGEAWSPTVGWQRVAVVHQEPQLFPNLTVEENIVVGRERSRWLRHGVNAAERRLLEDMAIDSVANHPLASVTLAIQQRTEIARALAQDARVFLFDEPNSALTEEESDDLFRRMHGLAAAGRVVILVSHRLAELVAHCDTVAIVRDGRTALQLEGDSLSQEAIARELVVGTSARDAELAAAAMEGGASLLHVRGWTHTGGEFAGVDLDLQAGRIVALVGVEGSGARELVRSMAGFESATGKADVAGTGGGLSEATAFVSADRQASLFANLSIGENMVSRLRSEISGPLGLLRRGQMSGLAREGIRRFRIKAHSAGRPIRSLSGGNQQKVAIAAAIILRPHILVLEEPTRGVDIGSKREIYRLLREYAAQGNAIIIYCTEVPEVFEAADVVYVVADGRLSPSLLVRAHGEVQELAAEITRLERHGRPGTAGPETPGPETAGAGLA